MNHRCTRYFYSDRFHTEEVGGLKPSVRALLPEPGHTRVTQLVQGGSPPSRPGCAGSLFASLSHGNPRVSPSRAQPRGRLGCKSHSGMAQVCLDRACWVVMAPAVVKLWVWSLGSGPSLHFGLRLQESCCNFIAEQWGSCLFLWLIMSAAGGRPLAQRVLAMG